jgi:hypothetical protein
MHDPISTPAGGAPAVSAFRAALGAAATRERGRKIQNPDKRAAVAGLSEDDLGRLIGKFEALLRGPADVGTLAADLHAALRALSPSGTEQEGDDDA